MMLCNGILQQQHLNCVLENMGSIEVGWPEISDILGLRDTSYIYILRHLMYKSWDWIFSQKSTHVH
jgi:hypothetical protein